MNFLKPLLILQEMFKRFPKVKTLFSKSLEQCLNNKLAEAQKHIRYAIKTRTHYINCELPEFIKDNDNRCKQRNQERKKTQKWVE